MAITGSIIGLAGSALTNITGYFNRRLDLKKMELEFQHEKLKWDHEAALFDLQMQAKAEETEQEAFLTDVMGSWKGLETSISDQSKALNGASEWVHNLLALFRPAITTGLLMLVAYFSLTGVETAVTVVTALDLAAMAVTWWFGDRSIKRATQAMKQ